MASPVVARADTRRDRFWLPRVFGSTRRVWTALAFAAVLSVAAAWAGLRTAPVPAMDSDGATVPMWRLLAMGVSVLPALGLHSNLRHLEEAATAHHRRAERYYLGGLSIACVGMFLAVASLGMQGSVLVIVARSALAWLGLALMSGRVLGWRLAWVLPVVVLSALVYWGGSAGDGEDWAWWEFSARPGDDVPSLLLSAGLLACGLVAYAATPWRRKRLADRFGAPRQIR